MHNQRSESKPSEKGAAQARGFANRSRAPDDSSTLAPCSDLERCGARAVWLAQCRANFSDPATEWRSRISQFLAIGGNRSKHSLYQAMVRPDQFGWKGYAYKRPKFPLRHDRGPSDPQDGDDSHREALRTKRQYISTLLDEIC